MPRYTKKMCAFNLHFGHTLAACHMLSPVGVGKFLFSSHWSWPGPEKIAKCSFKKQVLLKVSDYCSTAFNQCFLLLVSLEHWKWWGGRKPAKPAAISFYAMFCAHSCKHAVQHMVSVHPNTTWPWEDQEKSASNLWWKGVSSPSAGNSNPSFDVRCFLK